MTTPPARPAFVPLPVLPTAHPLPIAWPTPNRTLFDAPEHFFARTRVNPDYGRPGFTRDCGRRFHRGCDIAPVRVTATGQRTRVIFTNCATGADFASDEPTFVPHDDVFCVLAGEVTEVVTDESASDFGKHVVVAHHWPHNGETFFTLYAHLAEIRITQAASLATGQLIARIGQTSRNADARTWMAIAPHLHFELRNAVGQAYDPAGFLRAFLPK